MHDPSPPAASGPNAPSEETASGHASADVRTEILITSMIGVGILVALVVLAVFQAAPRELTAIGVGVLLALALDPVLGATRRRLHCSRVVGTVIVGSLATVALAGIVLVLGPQAADQASKFADELPATVEDFYSWPLIGERLEEADAVGRVEEFVADLPSRVDADSISDIAGRVFGGLGAALLVLVTAIAVLLDGDALVARARRAIPSDRQDRADEIGRIVYRSVARYFAGSVGVALLSGVVILTSGLILGVPLAPLAAVWAAVTNLIPQIGGFLGGSFFVLLATTQGALPGLIALAVFLIYQQIENNVIQPTVIGQAVNLTPPTTMLAALIGGAAAGVPGALVATPLVGAVKSVWMDTHRGAESDDDGDEESDKHKDEGDDEGDDEDDSTDDRSLLRKVVDRITPS